MPVYAEDVTPRVAVSNSHTVVLKADGTVWSWGQGGSGQLGNGITYDWTKPVLAPVQANIADVKYIAIGNSNTYAIKKDGTLWAWGFNGNGELGVGDKIDRNVPTQISVLTDIIQVAGTSGGFAACLKADGTVWAWGANSITIGGIFYGGQLGNGTTTSSTIPVRSGETVTEFVDIKQIDVGAGFVLARKGDGTVWTWGLNSYKQCGRTGQTYYTRPGQVTTTGIVNITRINAGSHHAVVLKNDGTVWTWGRNQYGQLGNGKVLVNEVSPGVYEGEYIDDTSYTPAKVPNLEGITDIDAGTGHTMIIKGDNTIWSVGMNYRGQFGDGNVLLYIPQGTEEFRQALISGPLLQLETFGQNTAFLKTDGSLWTCGANSTGQVGNGTTSLYVDVPTMVVQGLNSVSGYSVSFDLAGGVRTGGGSLLQIIERGQAATAPTTTKTGAVFNGWNKSLTDIVENQTITAQWLYGLNVSIFGEGSVRKTPDLEHYLGGTSVTLTAVPSPGWGFAGWSNEFVNPIVIEIPPAETITAFFLRIGDLDWNNVVNLADAVTVLRILTGLPVEEPVLGAGTQSDGKISPADAIYILQTVAEIR